VERIIQLVIQSQDILHAEEKPGVYLGDTPLLVQPWSDIPFLSVSRTVSEIWSEVVYGEDEAGGVSLVDLNTTNPERMDTPCTRIRESRSDIQR
ncbi:MAG: hypothetical protein V1255_05615, partial [Alphaproteobacteria bacterium]|nr:hypothetical protein [Alphaproteobacteria bacterium]